MAASSILSVETERHRNVYYYYVATAGSLLAIVVISLMLGNICYHYWKSFYSSKRTLRDSVQSKSPYILFMLLSIVSILICAIYAFFRGDLLIPYDTNSPAFALQCEIAHLSGFTLSAVYTMLMYWLFIRRIQIVFKATVYAYPPTLFLVLYSLIFVGFGVCAVLLFVGHQSTFALYRFRRSSVIYCGLTYAATSNVINYVTSITFMVLMILFSLISLVMFTYKLYTLENELLQQYLAEIQSKPMPVGTANMVEMRSNSSIGGPVSPPSRTRSPTDEYEQRMPRIKRKVTVEHIITKSKKGDHSAKRILELHKLIKKYTILVFIMVITMVVWLVTTSLIDSWFWLQIVWMIVINDAAIFLTFGSSEKYWLFSTRFLCCWLCYHNKDRPIDRSCLCFHC